MKKICFLTFLLLALLISTSLQATSYVVSGAGSNVNGTYNDTGFLNGGKPFYVLDTNNSLALIHAGNAWEIAGIGPNYGSDGAAVIAVYYYTLDAGDTPPSTGWWALGGVAPIPMVKPESGALSYSSFIFTESPENDGTIDNTITITYSNQAGETFTGINGEDFIVNGKAVVANVPAGLTARVFKKDDHTLTAVLAGSATSHANANDVSNLKFTFKNSAFSSGDASVIGDSYRAGIGINFIQIINVGTSGTYTTIAAALNAAGKGDILNLAAETFTETGLEVGYYYSESGWKYLENVTIQGQGANNTIIQAAATPTTGSYIFSQSDNSTFTIKDLTIRHGDGIYSAGDLTLRNVTITNNLDGGITSTGKVTMINCSVLNNGSGGKVEGGGMRIEGNAYIENSTIAYNQAISGAGIYCFTGSLYLTNSTIARNSGTGISVIEGNVEIVNSILALNNSADYDVRNSVGLTDRGYNIVEKQQQTNVSGSWHFTHTTDILFNYKADGSAGTQWTRNNAALGNQNLNLAVTPGDNSTLNGTKTLALSTGSFAIDAGTGNGAPSTDQRGLARSGVADIGAYEYNGVSATKPTVTTAAASAISYTSATLGGNVISDGGATVTERGVVYSITGIPDISDTKVQIGSGTGSFSQAVTGLFYNATYYVRAYAVNSAGTAYGTLQTFTTKLTNPLIGNLDGDSGSFKEGDNPLVIDIGANATVTGTIYGYNGGKLTASISSASNTESLAISTSGTVSLSAGMSDGSIVSIGGTTIGTIAASNNGQAGSSLVINLNSNATDALMSSLIQNITYSNNSEVALGTRTVSVTVQEATGLTNSATAVTISTIVVNDPPTLTMDASNVTPSFWRNGPEVSLFSGDGVGATASTIENGQTFKRFTLTVTNVSDGASEELIVDDTYIQLSNGSSGVTSTNSLNYSVSVTGSTATVTISGGSLTAADFQSLINWLSYANTNASATLGSRVVTITSLTDNGGTANGGIDTAVLSISSTVTIFTYLPPTVTTSAVTIDSNNSATFSGNVTSDGGTPITQRGFVYSATDETPTSAEGYVELLFNSQDKTGTFSDWVSHLWGGQTFYVRAFAVNSEGITYGNTVTFKTSTLPLSITTSPDLVVAYGNPYYYAVGAAASDGQTGTVTAPTKPAWLALNAVNVNSVSLPATIDCATTDAAGNIYAVTDGGSNIYKVTPEGTTTLWGSGYGTVHSIHIADGYMYFGAMNYYGNANIRRIPMNNPAATPEIFATISKGIFAMAHKDGWIYASSNYTYKIYRINESTKEVQLYIDQTIDKGAPYDLKFEMNGDLCVLYEYVFGALHQNIIAKYTGSSFSNAYSGRSVNFSRFFNLDANGNFYVISPAYGLYKYNSDFTSFKLIDYTTSTNGLLNTAYGAMVSVNGSNLYRWQTCSALGGVPSKSDVGSHSVVVRASNDAGYIEQSFTIQVIDTIKPVISALSPVDEATGVSLKPSLSVTFEEEVSLGTTGTLTVKSGATTLKTFDLSVANDRNALSLSANKKVLSFSLPGILPSNSAIGIEISQGFVKDLSNNAFAGITLTSGVWNFTSLLAQNPTIGNLNGDTGSFKEGDSALLIDNGANATVTDVNSAGFNGGNLTVAVTSASSTETLSIKTSATVVLSSGMTAGSTVSIGGTMIGSIATGKDGLTGHELVVTLNADATTALIGTLIQNISYSNNSELDLGSRTVAVTIQDAFVYTSSASNVTISTTVVNDPPTLTITGAYPTFTEHGQPVKVYSGASASTVESDQLFTGFSFVVTNLPDGASEQLVIDGTSFALTNGTTGTTATNSLTYTVSVAGSIASVGISGGSLSANDLQLVLNNLSYFNSSASPSTSPNRLFRIQSLKDNGGTANGGSNTASLFINSSVTVVATQVPTVTTAAVSTFDGVSATMGGNATADGGTAVTERGVVYSSVDNTPTIGENNVTQNANGTTGTGSFSKSINGLTAGTTYYVRAYAINAEGTAYGSMQSFTTLNLPTITTAAVSTYDGVSATMGGNVTADGGSSVTERGVVYSSVDNTPTIGETDVTKNISGTTGTETFSKSITGLTRGTTYYVRAYATNSEGTVYGSMQSFTTLNLSTVTTATVSAYDGVSATMGGNATADGGTAITERGVVYSSVDNTPTIGEANVTRNISGTTGTGTFSKSVTGLTRGTTYYVQAYAINAEGTAYGSMQSFTTLNLPTVSTTAITIFDDVSATFGGNVITDGGTTVTERGVVYSSIDNTPTIGEASVTKNVNGTTGTGSFSKTITGLTGNTTYYVRAYAINAEGTSYGSVQTFTTVNVLTLHNNALDFDGNSEYVNVLYKSCLDVSTGLTIETWINPVLSGMWQEFANLVMKGNYGYGLSLAGNGNSCGGANKLVYWDQELCSGTIRSSLTYSYNSWQHVAVTVEDIGSQLRIYFYVNGVQDGPYYSNQASISNGGASGGLYIGRQGATGDGNYFAGKMDELRIWNTARTAMEIRENMMRTLDGNESGLAAYYKFDQTGGITLFEGTANASNGTLTNMDSSTDWVDSEAFTTWLGGTSGTWSDDSNWSDGAPTASDNVGIYKWATGSEATLAGTPTFNHVVFSSTASPVLSSGFTVNGNFFLHKNLDLNGKTITLGSSATLFEGANRLYGSSGSITTTRSLSNLSAQNVGGLGAVITTTANMGSTVITRTHASQANVMGGKSVMRSYLVSPLNNNGLNATLVYNYHTDELNGITEAQLALHKSTDGGSTFTYQGGTVDAANNTITLTGIAGFGVFSAGISCSNPTNGGTIGTAQTICSGQTPSLITQTIAPGGTYAGNLQYKWQVSTTSAVAGFADLAGATSISCQPGALAQTSWFKRMVKVDCESSWLESNVVQITVNKPSFIASVFHVSDLRAIGTNIKWYAASVGGSALASNTVIANGTTYYASQTVNGVESSSRLAVTANLDSTPCAPTGQAAQVFADGSTVSNLTATGSNIRWYAASSGGSSLSASTQLVSGTHYYATQTIDCTESLLRLDVLVTILPN
jgi:hypothetical protein